MFKHRFVFLIIVALLFIIGILISQYTDAQINTTYYDCISLECTTWDTSFCKTTFYKEKSCTGSPTGCYFDQSILRQPCIPCINYSYGEWSECLFQHRTRTYTKVPEGCEYFPDPEPILIDSESCFRYCEYEFSDWGPCISDKQTRTVLSIESVEVKGCIPLPSEELATHLEQSCDSNEVLPTTPCTYTPSDWSVCSPAGIKTRVYTKTPAGCTESSPPATQKTCTYVPPTTTPSDSETTHPADIPAPTPESILSPENINQSNFNDRTSNEWQEYYFDSENCQDNNICGGSADPDNDSLNNNEEYRFGTNPKDSDTDNDGYLDGDEILRGTDPLVVPSEKSDKMVFESPLEKGETKKELFQITNIEMVKIEEVKAGVKITGKSLPNTYIILYIYSDPIILTIKTDSEGNWSYVLSEPLSEGEHQTYVALTDNTGKITAKSEPVRFIKTAEAATMIIPNQEISPTKSWFIGNYLIYIALGIGGIIITLISLGLIINSIKKQKEEIETENKSE